MNLVYILLIFFNQKNIEIYASEQKYEASGMLIMYSSFKDSKIQL